MKENMTIDELYNYLNSPEFQNVEANFSYNYYVYQYPASQEYKIRKEIHNFKENLERPTSCLNVMLLDLFEAFCDFLRNKKYGEQNYLDVVLKTDNNNQMNTTTLLTNVANSDEFIKHINHLITDHMDNNERLKSPYVFVYGIGKMFPYLRANTFLTKYEKYNAAYRYKIILFYPGHQKENSFSLFDVLEDSHAYRAILLVNK